MCYIIFSVGDNIYCTHNDIERNDDKTNAMQYLIDNSDEFVLF